jgi:glycosyltransferase involved in cell wall biosynthesis
MSVMPRYALYFAPDGYVTAGRPLMGRRAAGASFLDAWLDRHRGAPLPCYTDRASDFETFQAIAAARTDARRGLFLPRDEPQRLADPGCLYWPAPTFHEEAWRRARFAPGAFSIMGVTHTTASPGAMDALAAIPGSAMRAHDAVICTSQAVKVTVERVLDVAEDHLRQRTGATRFERPQLPVIPLGIDTASFAPDPALRAATRRQLDIADSDVAVLFLGRLSFHAKAHHIPMQMALQRATRASGRKMHLILCGWFANAAIEQRIRQGASDYMPDVTLHVLDGRNADTRAGAWRAADIFTSLVDNIQETFGLSPVEGMAAGLPCVVSDYDGYKETVRNGVDGFRIATTQPPPAEGIGFIDRLATQLDDYDRYLFHTSLNVTVDVAATADAFATLARDADLRRRMGEAARQRASAVFDWAPVLNAYDDLAGMLAQARHASADHAKRDWPARLSPWDAFAHYPTRVLEGRTTVMRDPAATPAIIATLAADSSAGLSESASAAQSVMAALADRTMSVDELGAALPAVPGRLVRTAVRRLLKFGLLKLA